MSFDKCLPWGWNDFLEASYSTLCQALGEGPKPEPGRVIWESHGIYGVVCPRVGRELRGRVSGRMQHDARSREDFPAVGDWVCLDDVDSDGDKRISQILPRRSCLKRKAAGEGMGLQVLAAQIDEIWILSSCNQDLSPERLERALVLASESGARARILFSKSDLLPPEQISELLTKIADRFSSIDRLAFSSRTGEGISELFALLRPGMTVVVIGSSGVGKSTLVNTLLGQDLLSVREVRESDAKGRHATTSRSLHLLPTGGLLLDTPGTRELQVFADPEALDEAFADIVELAQRCRFGNCTHESESSCAIKEALADGRLEEARWQNYLKLSREMAFQARRKDKGLQSDERRKWSQRSKDAQARSKFKRRS
jgi:ribosome biogenesis GTPase / thiamine phosphate phosphatase